MKIIVCGTVVPAEFENQIPQLSNAANRFQLNFLKELEKYNDIEVYSYIGIAVDEEIRQQLQMDNQNMHYYFRMDNLVGNILEYRKAVKSALRNADCLITYNVIYAWLYAPAMAGRLGKKSVLILADYSPADSYCSWLRRIYAWLTLKVIRKYNIVVGLSDKTKALLSPSQQFVCIEGGIDQRVFDYFSTDHCEAYRNGTITYMYAGILEKVTGIDRLLQAFTKIDDPAICLRISGKGSLDAMVKDYEQKDSRIQFLGCVAYEEYLANLKHADILINPRNMELPENANNFPSKIMEYLATGKYIISTKFPGWERNKQYIHFCDCSVEALQAAIEQSRIENDCDSNYIREFARRFMWSNQVKTIIEMIEKDR